MSDTAESPATFQKLALGQHIHAAFSKIIASQAMSQGMRGREFALKIIRYGTIFLLVVVGIRIIHDAVTEGAAYEGISILWFAAISSFFLGLLWMSQKGYFIAASYAVLLTCVAAELYSFYKWGPDLPEALLGIGLLIAVSSILISTRFGFIVLGVSALSIVALGYFEGAGVFVPSAAWKFKPLHAKDAIAFSVILAVITITSWLSNREIERSLRRSRRSEAELRRERNLLEAKVEERTRELRQAQLERMGQLSHFAEAGRLAAGMVHDLLSPLTAIALSVEELTRDGDVSVTKDCLSTAIQSARRMECLIEAIRKRMSQHDTQTYFSFHEEIEQVIRLFDYKAKKSKVAIYFCRGEDAHMFGDPVKLNQIVSNLVSNAIDAYDNAPPEKIDRHVTVTLTIHENVVRISVADSGTGISKENIGKIFDPFFTTKEVNKGTGLGLATVRYIVERVFGGTIRVVSAAGEGTEFIVELTVSPKALK